jgi:hypothetical protein
MSEICNTQRTCVVCGSEIAPLLDLDVQPPANILLAKPSDPYEAFPLGFANCPSCTHGQLTHFVDPAKLFKHYLYASGTSGTLKAYFEWFADTLRRAKPDGARLAEKCGLRVEASRLTSVHGTSLLSFLRRADEAVPPFQFEEGKPFSVGWPSPTPLSLSMAFDASEAARAYVDFADGAKTAMKTAAQAVERHRASGRKVALVGVAAKAMTFIRAAGIEPDTYLDEAALKVGLIIPGTALPIEPLQKAGEMAGDTTFLIGAWNFADELMKKIRNVSGKITPKFIVYFPKLVEI